MRVGMGLGSRYDIIVVVFGALTAGDTKIPGPCVYLSWFGFAAN